MQVSETLAVADSTASSSSCFVQIMIAESSARRKGRAREALQTMLCWAHQELVRP